MKNFNSIRINLLFEIFKRFKMKEPLETKFNKRLSKRKSSLVVVECWLEARAGCDAHCHRRRSGARSLKCDYSGNASLAEKGPNRQYIREFLDPRIFIPWIGLFLDMAHIIWKMFYSLIGNSRFFNLRAFIPRIRLQGILFELLMLFLVIIFSRSQGFLFQDFI